MKLLAAPASFVLLLVLPQDVAPAISPGVAGAFAGILGLVLGILEVAKRLMDRWELRKALRNGGPRTNEQVTKALVEMSHTMKGIARTLTTVESGMNANTSAMALLSQRAEIDRERDQHMGQCLRSLELAVVEIKGKLDNLAA